MVHNRITPNLLTVVLLAGGLYMTSRIKQEIHPEFELDMVTVTVQYPGASPAEVEKAILLSIETELRGIDGVKRLCATATENLGVVVVELLEGSNKHKVYQDIRQAVDRITTFPKDAERPEVTLLAQRRSVLKVMLFGEVSELVLREVVERTRDRLLQHSQISQVELLGARERRVFVEISQSTLRKHGLTLQEVSNRITSASVELPGGKIETRAGQILLRMKDRRDWARGFAQIPIIIAAGGGVLRLSDIATVTEGFEETNRFASYNRKRAMVLEVYRVGDQTPKSVSGAVRKVLSKVKSELPPGVKLAVRNDRSKRFEQRQSLLLKNAFMGLVIVLIVLAVFLELRLAFWVTMGIPTSFLGAMLFLPCLNVSFNMVSMFAFIIALGIVVDDAIVAGENIHEYRMRGMTLVQASIRGARDVATPVTFAILTNIVAFLPLYFMSGTMGKLWRVIPIVVITVFVISLVESLIILPAHLAHTRRKQARGQPGPIARFQRRIAGLLKAFIDRVYTPTLNLALRWRLVTVSLGLAALIAVVAFVASGRIGFILMPRVESDFAVATATLPHGSPESELTAVRDRLVGAVNRVARRNGGKKLVRGVSALVTENKVEVIAYLGKPTVRPINTREVTRRWRREIGAVAGLVSLRLESDRGGPLRGAALTMELSHHDIGLLERASRELATRLSEFPAVKDIDNGFTPGKRQLSFQITPAGQSLGLTSAEVGRQVRNSFYGAEALRQQRERNELRVFVRLPGEDRRSEADVERLLITTRTGRRVPLMEVAKVSRERAYTSINRRDGRRTITVTANIEPIGETGHIQRALSRNILPEMTARISGLTFRFEGRHAEKRDSMSSLLGGYIIALFVMYFLLAIPFRSYSLPGVVMLAIPFGIIGAVFGHILMGYNLSAISVMGMVALSGVVVNDSLVLLEYAGRRMRAGISVDEAVREAGVRRFRPIILTTLTTFGGLAPMILETSRQARFMIPMAISLGFGILFATFITLLLVPCITLLFEDVKRVFRRVA